MLTSATCSFKKRSFVSVVWLSWQQEHSLFHGVVTKVLELLTPHPCSGFLVVSVQEALEVQQCISNSCGPVDRKDAALWRWTRSLFKVLVALPETDIWLWCPSHISAKRSQEPVLSYGCMRLNHSRGELPWSWGEKSHTAHNYSRWMHWAQARLWLQWELITA